ncbi:MAG: methionyl-tRNA formyltransferase [Candidatus Omnitrophica bacterium]|nr:methionyl-tRNA formyltransferase [Candidatus Omnitrophota bacterium]
MNIVFFGSADFSVPSLKALLNGGHTVSCIVTQPDRKKGRGMHVGGTVFKEAGRSLGIPLYQPENVNSPDSLAVLQKLAPDMFVVIAYGQLLSGELLRIPRLFSVNVHASYLPRYRGAAPINWALVRGETETGVTVIKMTEKMDAGPIILQERVQIIDSDTCITLERRLADTGAALLLEAIKRIGARSFELSLQDDKSVSFAPKIKKENGLIVWSKTGRDIYNLVRGTLHRPGAYTRYQGGLLKIHAVRVSDDIAADRRPGEIIDVSKDGIRVAAGKGSVSILELQPEGKRVMKAEEFISGHKIKPGDRLE